MGATYLIVALSAWCRRIAASRPRMGGIPCRAKPAYFYPEPPTTKGARHAIPPLFAVVTRSAPQPARHVRVPGPQSDSGSPTPSTQGNPALSHWLGLETLQNWGPGRSPKVMTEEVAGISRWWFARRGRGSSILNSQFSILNYWRGEVGEIRSSEFGILRIRFIQVGRPAGRS